MNYANTYVKCSLVYLLIGMILGLYMAMTLDYSFKVTHVHLLMMGTLIQFGYAMIHKSFINVDGAVALAKWQFYLHQVGTILLAVGFVLIFGGHVHPAIAGSIAGLGSLAGMLAVIQMYILVKRYQG